MNPMNNWWKYVPMKKLTASEFFDQVFDQENQKKFKSVDSDDCVVLDNDPNEVLVQNNNNSGDGNDDSDDVLVICEKGQVACRDYPHSRHLCVKFPFSTTPKQSHCNKCYCFVCDSLAPCVYWGNGTANTDHCHANDKDEFWMLKRETVKNGSKVAKPVAQPMPPSVHILNPGLVHANYTPANFQRPRNNVLASRKKLHPDLTSRALVRTRQKYNLGSKVHKPVFKRTGAVMVAATGAVKVAPTGAVRVAPTEAVKAAPKGVVRVAPTCAVKAAPKGAVRVAPTATVKVAPKGAVRVAATGAVKVAPTSAVRVASTGTVGVAQTDAVRDVAQTVAAALRDEIARRSAARAARTDASRVAQTVAVPRRDAARVARTVAVERRNTARAARTYVGMVVQTVAVPRKNATRVARTDAVRVTPKANQNPTWGSFENVNRSLAPGAIRVASTGAVGDVARTVMDALRDEIARGNTARAARTGVGRVAQWYGF